MFGIYLNKKNDSRRISEFYETKPRTYQELRTMYQRIAQTHIVSPLGEYSYSYVNKETGELELVEISER